MDPDFFGEMRAAAPGAGRGADSAFTIRHPLEPLEAWVALET